MLVLVRRRGMAGLRVSWPLPREAKLEKRMMIVGFLKERKKYICMLCVCVKRGCKVLVKSEGRKYQHGQAQPSRRIEERKE
jgi:hypothetical protein